MARQSGGKGTLVIDREKKRRQQDREQTRWHGQEVPEEVSAETQVASAALAEWAIISTEQGRR
jgi:hypothetical protein